jgi:LysR family transcriptional activator of nhaA
MLKFNYHHLFYFRTIAAEGSISKAARKLRLGQPTLSMQLKQFEDFLGVPLFERKNRALILTEMGRVVQRYAEEIFRLGDEMVDTLQDQSSRRKLKLQLGASDSTPKAILTELVQLARQLGPCQVAIREASTQELIQALSQHQLDLVVSNSAGSLLGGGHRFFTKSLGKSALVVAGIPSLKMSGPFPMGLQNQRMLLPSIDSRVRHDFEHFLEIKKLQVEVFAEIQDVSLMKSLALAGEGLIVCSEKLIQEELRQGQLVVQGRLSGFNEEFFLISVQRKISNPIAAQLLESFQLS